MKKSEFWAPFLIGLAILLLAFVVLGLGINELKDTEALPISVTMMVVLYFVGVGFITVAGGSRGDGRPRHYLLDRMEYKKDIESRTKPKKKGDEDIEDVRLLLSKANKYNTFEFAKRFHLVPHNSLVDKDSNVLEELPETFFVRVVRTAEKTLYHIHPTRIDSA